MADDAGGEYSRGTSLFQLWSLAYQGAHLAMRGLRYGSSSSRLLLKSGSTYVAECLDLNLISEGPTPENAIQRLQEAMSGYLSIAFEGDANGLVLRPAPASRWIRYYWHSLKRKIRRHESHNHSLTYEPSGRLQHCP